MIRLNPDPKTEGYAFMPEQSVTSRFPPDCNVQAALQALTHGGVHDEHIEVYTGTAGADLLDTKGQLHGAWVRFVRAVQDRLTDEAPLFHRADETLRAGGSVVAVFIENPENDMRRTADVLKAHGGSDTVYWGGLVTEYL